MDTVMTMNRIGHYRRNITATEAINGGIQSLDIREERGTVDFAMKQDEVG